ncbi:serine hydrolase domain-containing protein [Sorangium sp. So ce341]|uniref:serine hydrolase domain-containing protein n=1 Tax=Sorangium sp. So ce341 TaxID=3133302 RepID=UPI003F611ED4
MSKTGNFRLPNLSRRRFGGLAMGGCTYLLAGGCAPHAASMRGLPAGVAPVDPRRRQEDGLARSAPEAQGISSDAILAFLEEVEQAKLELHSFMLMRNRHVVAEGWWWPYGSGRVHITHSLTKSVTSVAVGLAIDEGRFGFDDKVVSFFPESVPADASANMRAMTVHDLLTMQTGHEQETSGSMWRPIKTSWVAEFFKIPVPHKPGTKFVYTSAASFLLSAIISKTTGQPMADYLKPRFFEPMGIDNWRWDTSPGRINPGGNGLSWTTAASLKLGALHAQMGEWNGHRVLSEKWVRAATTKQVEHAEYGYGYQWWMGPGGAYYALGLFSQLAIVFPKHDATLAIFGAIRPSSSLRSIIWRHFPAALGAAALPPSPAAARLNDRTTRLRLRLPPLVKTDSPLAAGISGKRFSLQPNDQTVAWLSFDFTEGACTYRMCDEGGEHSITAGFTEYLEQDTSMTGHRLHHEYRPDRMRVVAGARWLAPDRLEMTWQFVESAFRDTVLCTFTTDSVAVDRSVNLNSDITRLPTLRGSLD